MNRDEHRKALQEDADNEMNELGLALHKAYGLAKRLAGRGRGVKMKALGLDPAAIKRLRDSAEDAYTLKKVKVNPT
jgi:hypothetical protein